MSQARWLFTLKMTIKAIGTRDYPQQMSSAKHVDWSKAQIVNI